MMSLAGLSEKERQGFKQNFWDTLNSFIGDYFSGPTGKAKRSIDTIFGWPQDLPV